MKVKRINPGNVDNFTLRRKDGSTVTANQSNDFTVELTKEEGQALVKTQLWREVKEETAGGQGS